MFYNQIQQFMPSWLVELLIPSSPMYTLNWMIHITILVFVVLRLVQRFYFIVKGMYNMYVYIYICMYVCINALIYIVCISLKNKEKKKLIIMIIIRPSVSFLYKGHSHTWNFNPKLQLNALFAKYNIPCTQHMTSNDDKNAKADLQYLRIGTGMYIYIYIDVCMYV